jgi:hypothetical protein
VPRLRAGYRAGVADDSRRAVISIHAVARHIGHVDGAIRTATPYPQQSHRK